MPMPTAPSCLTATDLVTGDRVYLGRNGDWTRNVAQALRFDDARTAELHLLDAEARAHEVQAPRLTPVTGDVVA